MSAELITTKQFVNTNLKAYYRFESGALTTDSSGEGHTLTAIGASIEDASGKFGGAATFSPETTDISYTVTTTNAAFSTRYWRSQPFTPTKNYLTAISVQLKKRNSPTGNITVEIQTDNASYPSGTVLATTTIDSATLTTSYAAYKVNVPTALTAGTKYHVCLKGQSAWDSTNDIDWGCETGTGFEYANSGAGNFTDIHSTTTRFSLLTYYNAAYSATDHADFKPTGNFTIGFWIKASDVPTATAGIFQSGSVNTNQAGFKVYLDTSGRVLFRLARNTGTVSGTDYITLTASSSVCDGNWYFIVCTWDGTNAIINRNGGSYTKTQAWEYACGYAATNYVRFGCLNATGTNGSFLTGSLDDVFLLNGTALSTEQIASIWSGMANVKINIGDVWKDAIGMQINIGDAWKTITNTSINIGDAWKTIF